MNLHLELSSISRIFRFQFGSSAILNYSILKLCRDYFDKERRDLLCNHSNGDLFTCEDIMFSRESSPGISLVFI